MLRALAVLPLGLLLLSPAPSAADQVARDRAEMSAMCRDMGGAPAAGPEFETRIDLTGDGRADVVLDYHHLDCRGAPSALCAGVGCPISVYVARGGDFERVESGRAQGWSVDRGASPPILTLTYSGILCGRPAHEVCTRRLQWNGAAFAPPGRAAAPATGAPNSSAPAATGWELRPVPGRGPVATVAGPGVVESLSMLCFDGRPMLALVLAAPPPRPVLSARAGGRTAEVALRREGASGPWVADLSGSRLPELLGGRAASAEIAVSGAAQGALSLRGSTAAIRAALADCGGG